MTINRNVVYSLTRCHTFRPPPSPLLLRPFQRDLSTGLMAMSMGVACPACIAAEMIVKGDITRKGVLSPATDVPCDLFMDQLNKRGIIVNEMIEQSK